MSSPAVAVHRPLVLSIPRAELDRLCVLHGPRLALAHCLGPDGAQLDGPRLLLALAGRESSFGRNLKPRHEPAYDTGGHYWRRSEQVRRFIARYGSAAACSYGPLQILAVNVPGSSPEELGADPALTMAASVTFMNQYVFVHWKAASLEAICNTWNAGSPHGKALPGYVADVTRYYQTETIGQSGDPVI